jgi:hypothetical protein
VPAVITNSVWGKTVGSVVAHGGTITQACNANYMLNGAARVGTCGNGSWGYNNTTECKQAVTVQYGWNNSWVSKAFADGTTVTCNLSTFGTDPLSGTIKACKIGNTYVGYEGVSFTVSTSPTVIIFCHGSNIPSDLGNANGVSVTGGDTVEVNSNTYKATIKVAAGTIALTNGNGSATLTCNSSGKWVNSGSRSFAYSGDVQKFYMPGGTANGVNIEVWGARGGDVGYSYGGSGGYTYGKKYKPGVNTLLYVYVGGVGGNPDGGWNGGGSGERGGGGASDVRVSGTALGNRIIVAGGGGGSSNGGGENGGTGGGGEKSSGGTGKCGGGNTTLNIGGGQSGCTSNLGQGQTASGGGYYGGCYFKSSGDQCGGGGGSGYCNTSLFTGGCSGSDGVKTGDGQVVISW